MTIGAPLDLSACRRFFLEPRQPRQRQYEALRAYVVPSMLDSLEVKVLSPTGWR